MHTIDLHLEHEKNLELIDFTVDIGENEIRKKIKMTYLMSLEIIYQLSQEIKYKKYFSQIQDSSDNKNSIVGAVFHKTLGKIFVILKKDLKYFVIKWTSSHGWVYKKEMKFTICENQTIKRKKHFFHFVGRSSMKEDPTYHLNYITKTEDKEFNQTTNFLFCTANKKNKIVYCPIDFSLKIDIKKLNHLYNEIHGYTIDYEDIKNRCSLNTSGILEVDLFQTKREFHAYDRFTFRT